MKPLTFCFAAAVAAAVLAATAAASCLPSTPAQQRARASVIFEGIALEGPTPTGVQRFRVSRSATKVLQSNACDGSRTLPR
jgi:hypothetical protein